MKASPGLGLLGDVSRSGSIHHAILPVICVTKTVISRNWLDSGFWGICGGITAKVGSLTIPASGGLFEFGRHLELAGLNEAGKVN